MLQQSTDVKTVMLRVWPLAAASLLLHAPSTGQTVPEGVHSDADGPSDVCGVSGTDALAIREKLKSDPTVVEKPSGSDRFETYFSSLESKQWTVTTRFDAAYPAVTCVYLYNSGEGTDMERQMRCDASREACDKLFLEFDAHDEQIRRRIRDR
ncbi:hypothetical protein LZ016_01800 [Sphingomonas sp. SM33]|uniref:Secreted protein n=1 Tax=Sphingomonas telluris TaxID=2907998 RepID=A0ABS9VIP8_9SPHN|nr:hypothetical protein [Sphingomonas telluris]MCH8614841.1 hypothetical protein [Sphingomonas telluris]